MKKTIWKKSRREIRQSLGRYLAILAIIALGVGFFAGLQIARPAMVQTADEYLGQHHFFDFRLLNTYGYTAEDVAAFEGLAQTEAAEGAIFTDALIQGADGTDRVFKLHSITEKVNTLSLTNGRMPENGQECVADSRYFSPEDIGTVLVLSKENNADTLEALRYQSYTIVGLANSPYYLNQQRGSTSLGNGTIAGFIYLPKNAFTSEYDSEIFLTLNAAGAAYSEDYDHTIDAVTPELTALNEERANLRYRTVLSEAQTALDEAQQEYDDAKIDYEAQKAEAEQKLADSLNELQDAEKKISDGENELNTRRQQLDAARGQIDAGTAQLNEQKALFQTQKAQLEAAGLQLDAAEAELNQKKADFSQQEAQARPLLVQKQQQLQLAIQQFDEAIAQAEALGAPTDALQAQKAQAQAGLDTVNGQLSALNAARLQLEEAGTQLAQNRTAFEQQKAQLEAGSQQLQNAEAQLSAAQGELQSGAAQIDEASRQLSSAKQELADGRKAYEEARQEADKKFEEAEQQLADAQRELADGRQKISELEKPDSYTLDRTSNIGYVCFDSDSNIVAGIAKVFPIFFFLVAALVCTTTMTRMIDEQRTLIGTMKALGYKKSAVMGSYLFYAGSAAIAGCIFGFLFGSYIFPATIWKAYGILYQEFAPIKFIFDLPLAVVSLCVSLVCSMGAAWFACYRELADVPANLIRPASPKSGKHIFLERIPFLWRRLSFLHKISIRNILRYKKRLVMMVLGIGGCTALLVTGLGLLDSIQNVVDAQYNEITLYDYAVSFRNEADTASRQEFLNKNSGVIENAAFVHEGSIDLVMPRESKSIRFVVADSKGLSGFIDLHNGRSPVSFPKQGEVILNDKLASLYGLKTGDTVTLRDADLHTLTLTVSGFFNNYVYNYAYISADSCLEQWGFIPEFKTGYLNIKDGVDPHEGAASVMDDGRVSSVTVNADTRDMIDTMMSSLNAVVLLVIFCAGALAFIVLYNLTNINILERVREIATIKVLGFHPIETAGYVFREILALTGIGALLGLGLGKALHAFVMSQIQIDMVSFENRIAPLSYIAAFLCTFLFAGLVCFAMYFRLKKIDMAQSLKSIE